MMMLDQPSWTSQFGLQMRDDNNGELNRMTTIVAPARQMGFLPADCNSLDH